jgi:hypothetical protein
MRDPRIWVGNMKEFDPLLLLNDLAILPIMSEWSANPELRSCC